MKKLALIGLVFLVSCGPTVKPIDIYIAAEAHNRLEQRVCILEGEKCTSRQKVEADKPK